MGGLSKKKAPKKTVKIKIGHTNHHALRLNDRIILIDCIANAAEPVKRKAPATRLNPWLHWNGTRFPWRFPPVRNHAKTSLRIPAGQKDFNLSARP
jgi:hypothetical protein